MSPASTNNHDGGIGLVVRGLSKSYGRLNVLRDLSFEVSPGEIFVIMGPSGSGKTVLLKHLIGLEEPDEGEILVEGQSIQSPEVLSRFRMAMVFQSGALLNSLTVGENVGLYLAEHRLKPPEEIGKIVADRLEVVGLGGTEHKMPTDLSGGMKKRVSIARALVIEPQMIFYDEPTSELDPISAGVIAEEIVGLNQRLNVTSVVVSHDRDLALGIADRIAVINEGRFLAMGKPDEVRQSKEPLVRDFLNADMKARKPSKAT
jgi:phospholipid/cholesterol/gamma-HCH transport system ATP-binding protein